MAIELLKPNKINKLNSEKSVYMGIVNIYIHGLPITL